MKDSVKIEKGITMVSLIVTVIILIILAGVSINLIIGDNGIIKTAKQAKQNTELAKVEEEYLNEIYTQMQEGGISGGFDFSAYAELDEFKRVIAEAITNRDVETSPNDSPDTMAGNIRRISGSGEGSDIEIDRSGANEPNLTRFAQKTYVTWNLNEAETEYVINDEQTEVPLNWYNYENGKWANIKTSANELEAYWVWIPRYEYIVPTATEATEIEVKFIPKTQVTADDGYTIHPAFTNEGNGGFGELDGIWVAKFEASSNTATPNTNYGGGSSTTLKVQVKPGVQSWRNIPTSQIFTVCRKMTNTGNVLAGSTVDSHMMKNMEWGAVAILSQSKYGIFNPQSSTGVNGDLTFQIWTNSNGYDSGKYIYTGYSGDSKDALTAYDSTTAPTNVIEYNKKNTSGLDGTKASTTGTVYGIYDMSGGSFEYIAGCLKGEENSKFGVSGTKYVDLYTNSSNSSSNCSGAKVGDATKETKGWNGDTLEFVNSSYPVFERGRSV